MYTMYGLFTTAIHYVHLCPMSFIGVLSQCHSEMDSMQFEKLPNSTNAVDHTIDSVS